jgi:hypothetical protein
MIDLILFLNALYTPEGLLLFIPIGIANASWASLNVSKAFLTSTVQSGVEDSTTVMRSPPGLRYYKRLSWAFYVQTID